jgi:hypothetical protein
MELIPNQLRDEWASIIGNFIIEFGNLESAISEVVRLSSLPNQFNILINLSFSKRVDLAEVALIEYNQNNKNDIKHAFIKIREITKRRNIIAHNGFSITIYEMENQKNHYEFGMTTAYKQNNIWLSKGDLECDILSLVELGNNVIGWVAPISKVG